MAVVAQRSVVYRCWLPSHPDDKVLGRTNPFKYADRYLKMAFEPLLESIWRGVDARIASHSTTSSIRYQADQLIRPLDNKRTTTIIGASIFPSFSVSGADHMVRNGGAVAFPFVVLLLACLAIDDRDVDLE